MYEESKKADKHIGSMNQLPTDLPIKTHNRRYKIFTTTLSLTKHMYEESKKTDKHIVLPLLYLLQNTCMKKVRKQTNILFYHYFISYKTRV